jgi:hypothetical protein
VIVPLIMLAILYFAQRVSGAPGIHPDKRLSARAGFWAGLLIAVIFVMVSLSSITGPDLRVGETLPDFRFLPLVLGIFVGFALLFGAWIALPTRFLGVITMALSSTSSIALFAYLFIQYMHSWMLFWSLGAALGFLLFMIFFPQAIRQIFMPGMIH